MQHSDLLVKIKIFKITIKIDIAFLRALYTNQLNNAPKCVYCTAAVKGVLLIIEMY